MDERKFTIKLGASALASVLGISICIVGFVYGGSNYTQNSPKPKVVAQYGKAKETLSILERLRDRYILELPYENSQTRSLMGLFRRENSQRLSVLEDAISSVKEESGTMKKHPEFIRHERNRRLSIATVLAGIALVGVGSCYGLYQGFNKYK